MPQELQTARIPPRKQIRLIDVFQAAKRATEMGLSVSFPATVVSFNSTTQQVDVTPDFLAVRYTEDGTQIHPPVRLVNLPVRFEGQGASGGGYMTFPVEPGHKGHVVVSDRSLEKWLTSGKQDAPGLPQTHVEVDGVFNTGLRDQSRAIPSFDPVAAVLEHTMIKLGASAAEAAVLGNTLVTWIGQLDGWLTAHIHTAPGGVGGPTTPPTVLPVPPLPNILSAKVKVG
jgi:hypothetical protein